MADYAPPLGVAAVAAAAAAADGDELGPDMLFPRPRPQGKNDDDGDDDPVIAMLLGGDSNAASGGWLKSGGRRRRKRRSSVDDDDERKSMRINWAASPHRERLSAVLDDWFSRKGMAIDESTGSPIENYRAYAAKVGIAHPTLYKYIRDDLGKRRSLPPKEGGGGVEAEEEEEYRGRGKRRLIGDRGVREIAAELRIKAGASEDGFARKDAVEMIMQRYGLGRTNASRQLTRYILPMMTRDDDKIDDDEPITAATRNNGLADAVDNDAQEKENADALASRDPMVTPKQPQKPPKSIVIAGVTSRAGRALLGYYFRRGHIVAGCGRDEKEVESLRASHPGAMLDVVNIMDDRDVGLWAAALEEAGTRFDLVIAADAISLEAPLGVVPTAAWEVPAMDFNYMIDVNVKGVANVMRHFVPRMIRDNTGDHGVGKATGSEVAGSEKGGAFVALSSAFGRTPHPGRAAYCASKFAIEGMVKSLAMSLPVPMCAVPLAPGNLAEEAADAHEKLQDADAEARMRNVMDKWVTKAGPMILGLRRKDNGKSKSVVGYYSVRERQAWVIPDGTSIPRKRSHRT